MYEIAVERAGGQPGEVDLSSRYIALTWPYLSKGMADRALATLVQHGLLTQAKKQSGTYGLPRPLSAASLADLEERLGTAGAAAKEAEQIDAEWKMKKEETRNFAIRKTLEAELAAQTDADTDE